MYTKEGLKAIRAYEAENPNARDADDVFYPKFDEAPSPPKSGRTGRVYAVQKTLPDGSVVLLPPNDEGSLSVE